MNKTEDLDIHEDQMALTDNFLNELWKKYEQLYLELDNLTILAEYGIDVPPGDLIWKKYQDIIKFYY